MARGRNAGFQAQLEKGQNHPVRSPCQPYCCEALNTVCENEIYLDRQVKPFLQEELFPTPSVASLDSYRS